MTTKIALDQAEAINDGVLATSASEGLKPVATVVLDDTSISVKLAKAIVWKLKLIPVLIDGSRLDKK